MSHPAQAQALWQLRMSLQQQRHGHWHCLSQLPLHQLENEAQRLKSPAAASPQPRHGHWRVQLLVCASESGVAARNERRQRGQPNRQPVRQLARPCPRRTRRPSQRRRSTRARRKQRRLRGSPDCRARTRGRCKMVLTSRESKCKIQTRRGSRGGRAGRRLLGGAQGRIHSAPQCGQHRTCRRRLQGTKCRNHCMPAWQVPLVLHCALLRLAQQQRVPR